MEFSVACLTSASRLARDVAVGRKPVNNVDQSDVAFLMEKVNGHLNKEQKEVVETALKQPFTVIEGPPGCGKTHTAVHLACLFVHRNRMMPRSAGSDIAQWQVLICASSDATLEVLAAYFRLLGQACPHVVHVYDERVERRQYPLPRGTLPPNKLKVGSDINVEQQAAGLHHLIRSPSCCYHQNILKYDKLFAQYDTLVDVYPESFADEQIETYQMMVREAEIEELRKAEIILATCSSVASSRIAMGTNIKQVIVDNCESCIEAESLLPVILMRSAQQLVLLGDRQQLMPKVKNRTAHALGLGRSLLERYANTALPLSKHYRMSQGIAEVSSECFYNSRLSPSELGPGSAAQPLVFYHVVGQEDVQMTATEAGVVESICNVKEAESVACIIEDLVKKGVAACRLAVLTQYTAQLHLIKKHLALKQLSSIAVHSVTQSQGCEFDFVVYSTCRSLRRSEVQKVPSGVWLQSHLGEIADPHQMNVAFTRAREVLIITGNKYLLQCHSVWKKLLDHCRKRKSLIDVRANV